MSAGMAGASRWHRLRRDRQQHGARRRLHPHRNRHRGRDRGNHGRGRVRDLARVALARRIHGRHRVRPVPGQRANDGPGSRRRNARLRAGRVRRRYRGATSCRRSERSAHADDAAHTAHARDDRRNRVAGKGTVRIHRARERIAERASAVSRRGHGKNRRRLPGKRRISFCHPGGRWTRGPVRTVPHETGGERSGDANGMAVGAERTEPDAVQRLRLHGWSASGRARFDGELSAELRTDQRRLHADSIIRLGRTLSRDDNGRTRDDRHWRNGLVHRASNADKRKRGTSRYAGVDPDQRCNRRRDLQRSAAGLAIVRICIQRDGHSGRQLHGNGTSRPIGNHGSGDGLSRRHHHDWRCTRGNAVPVATTLRLSRKREMLSSDRRSNDETI